MCSSPATRRSSSVARPSAMVVVWNVAWHFSECAATQNRLTVAPRGSQRRTLLHLANGSAMSVAGFALLARAVRMSSYTTRWFTAATTRIAVKLLYLYILPWTDGVLYPRSVVQWSKPSMVVNQGHKAYHIHCFGKICCTQYYTHVPWKMLRNRGDCTWWLNRLKLE